MANKNLTECHSYMSYTWFELVPAFASSGASGLSAEPLAAAAGAADAMAGRVALINCEILPVLYPSSFSC